MAVTEQKRWLASARGFSVVVVTRYHVVLVHQHSTKAAPHCAVHKAVHRIYSGRAAKTVNARAGAAAAYWAQLNHVQVCGTRERHVNMSNPGAVEEPVGGRVGRNACADTEWRGGDAGIARNRPTWWRAVRGRLCRTWRRTWRRTRHAAAVVAGT